MSLRDPLRSFWISTLDCLRIFGVSLSRRIFYLFFFYTDFFFSFPFYFWGFLNKDLLFYSVHWLIFKSIIFLAHFPLLAGKLGTMGPGFI